MVERRGLLLSDTAPVTTGEVPADSLRIAVTRASASVPGCPDWSTKSSITFNTATSSNYGRATNSNLAAMVADPNDLTTGATDTRNDTAAATRPGRTDRETNANGPSGRPKGAETTTER